jgi:23S rRNA pseudouridine1911/1915/1917 synthase
VSPAILYEDNHFLLVNKPAGILVQGDKTGDPTLTDWAKAYIKETYNKPGEVFLHPCHRIDRPVSGIVVFARTSKGLERMNRLFKEDKVEKEYLAIVQNQPEEAKGHLVHWLRKDPTRNITMASKKQLSGSKQAELSYITLAYQDNHSLVRVFPKTGRPHQIRVQLKAINCPIKGDLKYGYPTPNPDKSISLHAFRISFVHPIRKEVISVTCKPVWSTFKTHIDELD